LRGVDRGGGAVVDHAERSDKFAGIDIGGLIDRGERTGDVALVVRVEQAVRKDVAQNALVEVVVGT